MWILLHKVPRFSNSVQVKVTSRITVGEGMYAQLFTVVRQKN